jgi:hypothetical protein
MARSKPKLLPTHESRQQSSVCSTLNEALDDHAQLSMVVVAAVVKNPDGTSGIRVYSSLSNHFERIGLLEEAKDALLAD